MIRIENIHKRFGKLPVLNGLSLQLNKGECVALIGPNGCGKTTLIKIILGMVLPDNGAVYIQDKNIANDITYRNDIGYMPQIGRYPENMTIGQLISMLQDIRKSRSTAIDDALLQQYDLAQLQHKRLQTLSGGTIQKVSAMLAFMFSPHILILDEPTAGLDPIASEILKDKIIQERDNDKLILITSHLLNELEGLITHVVFMHEGVALFKHEVDKLKEITGEERIGKAINQILVNQMQHPS